MTPITTRAGNGALDSPPWGLVEALIRVCVRYGSTESVAVIDRLYGFIAREAYLASTQLAAEIIPVTMPNHIWTVDS